MIRIFILATILALTPTIAFADDPRPLSPGDLPPAVLLKILQDAKGSRAITVVGTLSNFVVAIEPRVDDPPQPPAPTTIPAPFVPTWRYVGRADGGYVVIWDGQSRGWFNHQLNAEQQYRDLSRER